MTEVLSDRLTAFICSLPERHEYTREDLLVPEVELAEEPAGTLVVYDAPIGWVNRGARVALIGVTPGFTQMQIVYRAVRKHLPAGASREEACGLAKYEASFGGTMRRNLVRMLDDLGAGELLGVASTADLFGDASDLLHTTSVVRYPTFLDAVFVPLGKSVAAVLELLETERRIPDGRTLYRFPHPSGANGHRTRQFEDARPRLRQCLKEALNGTIRSGAAQQHAADGATRCR